MAGTQKEGPLATDLSLYDEPNKERLFRVSDAVGVSSVARNCSCSLCRRFRKYLRYTPRPLSVEPSSTEQYRFRE